MKEKNLKLIMELIFIFIFPLVILLPCISIDNKYVYDNYGNFESSNKVIDFDSPFVYTKTTIIDNSYYSSYVSCNIYDFINVDTITIENNTRFRIPMSLISEEENYTSWLLYYKSTSNDYFIMFYYDFTNYYFYFSKNLGEEDYVKSLVNVIYEDSSVIIFQFNENINYTNSILDSEPDINESFFYANFIEDIDITVNNTIMGNIKLLFTNYLDFNDSVILDLFIAYNTLWLMMFISWHFLYALFDFVAHLLKIPIKRRE